MLVMFCQTVSMLVFNMTVHNMHATVLACTHSHKLTVHALCSVLGLGHPHLVTKVIFIYLFLGVRDSGDA